MLQHDKKTRPSYSQRVGHLHVARTSTYLRTRRFPSAVVSFSFEKTVLTHISCRDGATVNTIFSLSSEIAGFTSSLAKPVHGSVPLVMQRCDSLSKFVTKHTRFDCDDDARSSYNLNTRYCDSSSPSQVSGQKKSCPKASDLFLLEKAREALYSYSSLAVEDRHSMAR